MTAERQKAERQGRWAEAFAAGFLRLKGYRILGRRVRTGSGEIDIIAAKAKTIAIIEVKYRQSQDAAITAVAAPDQRRLVRAARRWLGQNPHYNDFTIRFDVIAMANRKWPLHLVSAFEDQM